MDRIANVMRTPHGEENLNKLRVPEFGIIKLCVATDAKASKFHQPKGAPEPASPDTGSDDFHFAPEHETLEIQYEILDPFAQVKGAKLELFCRYAKKALWSLDFEKLGADWWAHGKHVVKWDGRVVKATAEQKGTAKDGGLEHDLTKIDPDKDLKPFPDGYVTLENTPYKLKMTLTAAEEKLAGNPGAAWTYFHILLKSIELELGPEETVPAATVDDDRHKLDKAIHKKIEDDGGLPDDGVTQRVLLISNLYKTASGQMDDNTGHDVYQGLWSEGPNIPIVAKIRLADSNDAEVKLEESDKGAVALGNAKFLWDWEDPEEDVDSAQSQAKPKRFIKKAIDYYKDGTDAGRSAKDHTYPKGDNCHVDRSGKRGPDAKPLFPNQAGYDPKDDLDDGKFPFKVRCGSRRRPNTPAKRKWAAYSLGWTSGKLKGQTGVVFQPSRMAGDDYKVTVYLAYDKSEAKKWVLDDTAEPLKAPDAIKKATGTFQIWREIHVARYICKDGTIVPFLPANLGDVQSIYGEAYLQVEDKMEGDDSYTVADHCKADGNKVDYNAICENILTNSGNGLYTQEIVVEAGADHASEDSAFLVRTYPEFVKKLHEELTGGGNADWPGTGSWPSPEGLAAKVFPAPVALTALPAGVQQKIGRLQQTQNWLNNNGYNTKEAYADNQDDKLCTLIETQMASDLQLISGGKDGGDMGAKDGITIIHFNYTHTVLRDLIAADPNVGSILGSAVDPGDAGRNKCAFLYLCPRLDTLVHEIGHHLFMPHAPTAGGYIRDRHDDSDSNCMMSYNRPRPAFCGLCQLRLRGWSSDALQKDRADNKKP